MNRAEGLEQVDAVVEKAVNHGREMEGDHYSDQRVVSTLLPALIILPIVRETANPFIIAPHLSIATSGAHI